jgi:hypothetical protein
MRSRVATVNRYGSQSRETIALYLSKGGAPESSLTAVQRSEGDLDIEVYRTLKASRATQDRPGIQAHPTVATREKSFPYGTI